jgi:hypothetical protein
MLILSFEEYVRRRFPCAEKYGIGKNLLWISYQDYIESRGKNE